MLTLGLGLHCISRRDFNTGLAAQSGVLRASPRTAAIRSRPSPPVCTTARSSCPAGSGRPPKACPDPSCVKKEHDLLEIVDDVADRRVAPLIQCAEQYCGDLACNRMNLVDKDQAGIDPDGARRTVRQFASLHKSDRQSFLVGEESAPASKMIGSSCRSIVRQSGEPASSCRHRRRPYEHFIEEPLAPPFGLPRLIVPSSWISYLADHPQRVHALSVPDPCRSRLSSYDLHSVARQMGDNVTVRAGRIRTAAVRPPHRQAATMPRLRSLRLPPLRRSCQPAIPAPLRKHLHPAIQPVGSADASGRSLEEWSASLFSPSELPPSGGTFPTNSLPNTFLGPCPFGYRPHRERDLSPPERRHPGRLSRPKLYDNDLAIHPHDRRLCVSNSQFSRWIQD